MTGPEGRTKKLLEICQDDFEDRIIPELCAACTHSFVDEIEGGFDCLAQYDPRACYQIKAMVWEAIEGLEVMIGKPKSVPVA